MFVCSGYLSKGAWGGCENWRGWAKQWGSLRTTSSCSEQVEKGGLATHPRDRLLPRSGSFANSRGITEFRLLPQAWVGMDWGAIQLPSTPCSHHAIAVRIQLWTQEVASALKELIFQQLEESEVGVRRGPKIDNLKRKQGKVRQL